MPLSSAITTALFISWGVTPRYSNCPSPFLSVSSALFSSSPPVPRTYTVRLSASSAVIFSTRSLCRDNATCIPSPAAAAVSGRDANTAANTADARTTKNSNAVRRFLFANVLFIASFLLIVHSPFRRD